MSNEVPTDTAAWLTVTADERGAMVVLSMTTLVGLIAKDSDSITMVLVSANGGACATTQPACSHRKKEMMEKERPKYIFAAGCAQNGQKERSDLSAPLGKGGQVGTR